VSDEGRSGLEDQLRSWLSREQPPAGFSDRLISRIRIVTASHSVIGGTRRGEWLHFVLASVTLRWAAAAGFACLMIAAGAIRYREYRQTKTEGEIAKEQAILGLRIASAKLNVALKQMRDIEDRGTRGENKTRRARRMEHL
jgi:hypothetical protein